MKLRLEEHAVHIWPVKMAASKEVVEHYLQYLSVFELDRVNRYQFKHLREASVLRSGAVRLILSKYLDTSPRSLQFKYGSSGKPEVVTSVGIHYNLSHSVDLALIAVCMGCEIGVDVERVRALPDLAELLTSACCRDETAEILNAPTRFQEWLFFRCWTRKEAFLKATGRGLSVPMTSFSVGARMTGLPRLHRNGDYAADSRAWALADLEVGPEYVAAVAYRDRARRIKTLPVVSQLDVLSSATSPSGT